MRALLLGLLMMIAGVSWAEGSFISGNELQEKCSSSDKGNIQFCTAYVLGIADDLGNNVINGYRACFPDNVLTARVTFIVKQFLKSHPDDLDNGANGLVAAAIAKAFPCNR